MKVPLNPKMWPSVLSKQIICKERNRSGKWIYSALDIHTHTGISVAELFEFLKPLEIVFIHLCLALYLVIAWCEAVETPIYQK